MKDYILSTDEDVQKVPLTNAHDHMDIIIHCNC